MANKSDSDYSSCLSKMKREGVSISLVVVLRWRCISISHVMMKHFSHKRHVSTRFSRNWHPVTFRNRMQILYLQDFTFLYPVILRRFGRIFAQYLAILQNIPYPAKSRRISFASTPPKAGTNSDTKFGLQSLLSDKKSFLASKK